jgi:hypothetical protein
MSDKQKTSNLLGSVLLCAGLLVLFVGERVLGANLGRTLGTSLGVLLLLAACGLRGVSFARASGDARAVEARLLASYAGVVVAMVLYALSTDTVTEALKLDGDSKDHYVAVLTVLWPAVLTVSLSALLFMELVYARMPIAASVELRRVRTASYAGLTLAFSAVFLLSLNYVVDARDVRKDLSYFKTTQPSGSTLKMLDKLEKPVKVVLFWRKSDDVLQQIEPYFATLATHSKKLTYEVLDSAFVPELCRKHRINGNGSVLLLQGEGDQQKGQAITVGNELTAARSELKKLDALFQTSFTKLTRAERSVALTVGHGEHNTPRGDEKPGDTVRLMDEVWRRLYIKTTKLGLTEGLASNVPTNTGAVVVVGPSEKFLPEETDALLTYVRKGGRLMLMIDPDADDGLDPLLNGLGLARKPGTVANDTTHLRRAHDDTDKILIYSNKFSSHPTVTTAARFQADVASIFVGAAALERYAGKPEPKPKPNVTFPLRTVTGFYRDLNHNFKRDENEPLEFDDLIAAVTVSEGQGAPEGRAVVIGDGDFMTDKVSSNNGNVMVFADSLGWLIGNEDLNAEVSSEEDVPIEHSRQQDKIWFYATTFGVPLPLLGLAAWVSRRRRRPSEAA